MRTSYPVVNMPAKVCLAFIAVLIGVLALSVAPLHATPFSKSQVGQDIDQLVKTLKRIHPNLYAHKKPKEFAAAVKAVRESVEPESSGDQAAVYFQRILGAVCDEHTSVEFDLGGRIKFEGGEKFYGQHLIVEENRILIDNSSIKYVPRKITNINGRTSREIRRFLRAISLSDGCAHDATLFTRYQYPAFPILFSRWLKLDTKFFPIGVADLQEQEGKDQTEATTSYLSILASMFRRHDSKREYLLLKHGLTESFDLYAAKNKHGNDIILVRHDPLHKTYYIYVSSMLGGKKKQKTLNSYLRKIIRNKPEHVILDLTENSGGSMRNAGQLISYFLNRSHKLFNHVRIRHGNTNMGKTFTWNSEEIRKAHRRTIRQFKRTRRRNGQYRLPVRRTSYGNPDYKGKLTILVGPATRSAATTATIVLKRKRKTNIIGYLSNNAKTACFAAAGHFQLKNTGIKILVPSTCYDRHPDASKTGNSLKPDIEVDILAAGSTDLSLKILQTALEKIIPINAEANLLE